MVERIILFGVLLSVVLYFLPYFKYILINFDELIIGLAKPLGEFIELFVSSSREKVDEIAIIIIILTLSVIVILVVHLFTLII